MITRVRGLRERRFCARASLGVVVTLCLTLPVGIGCGDREPEGETDEIQRLIGSLDVRNPVSFEKICDQLAGKGDAAIYALLDAMDYSDPDVYELPWAEAISVIGNRCLPVLLEAICDPEDSRRVAAAIGMRKLAQQPWKDLALVDGELIAEGPGLEAAVPALLQALENDASNVVRCECAVTLGKFGDAAPRIVEGLRAALRSGDSALRVASAAALGKIGPSARAAVPDLREALDHESHEVRQAAIIALGRMGPAARAAIPALIECTADESERVRMWSASALGKMGSEAGVARDVLIERLDEDPVGEVRYYAAMSLGRIGAGPEVILPPLTRALADRNPRVRSRAAQSIGEIGVASSGALEALLDLLARDPGAREVAVWTLGRLGKEDPDGLAGSIVPRLVKGDATLVEVLPEVMSLAGEEACERLLEKCRNTNGIDVKDLADSLVR